MTDNQLQIIDFNQVTENHFRTLNLEWIEHYFEVEAEDHKVLNDPQTHIIDTGGAVIYARYQDMIVGTCALKKWSDEEYELSKMGVKPNFQGLKIGTKLAKAIIKIAESKGCKRLFLDSNRKLETAINLYRKLGFNEVPQINNATPYQRCDITMELFLNSTD